MCAFTGAGVSTSTGIPDYRSGYKTVLETGPGQWELEAYKLKYKQDMLRNGKPLPAAQTRSFHIAEARASLTHMALVELQSRGILKGVVSQNVDGLHRKSGIIPENMAEVHGNINLEYCSRCNKEHMRDYRTRTAKTVHDHKTGGYAMTVEAISWTLSLTLVTILMHRSWHGARDSTLRQILPSAWAPA